MLVSPKAAKNPNPVFAENLKAALDHAGLMQTDLARLLAISDATVSQYVSGEVTPRPHRLRQIASIVHATVDWLLGQGEMERGLQHKLLRIYSTIGRERLDYLDEMDAAELREMIDRHELEATRRRRRSRQQEPKPEGPE